MTQNEMICKVEKVEEMLFNMSFYRQANIKSLTYIYNLLKRLEKEFLLVDFKDIKVVKDLGFKINECILQVKIYIRDFKGLTTKEEKGKIIELWNAK